MSVRIAMMLKRKFHEPVVVLSMDLIDRLVKRFSILLNAFKAQRARNRKKIFNFKFLTKVFLMMEKETELAEVFENHKTRQVLVKENNRVSQTCKGITMEDGFNWQYFRSA